MAEGVNAHSTTYCPGCGHGLAQKYLAEAIDELGVQDRTVLVSPVGCSVFSYYYFDVGNSQAAARARSGRGDRPQDGEPGTRSSICYQGDGDLASIGLAEIISTAQLGIPITVIFINNAIYGMTGGQMAPTTLIGQRTSTTPNGRSLLAGQPLKMAELIAEPRRTRLCRARRPVRQQAADPRQAGHQEGARASGHRYAASPSSRSCPSARCISVSIPRLPRTGCGTTWSRSSRSG